MVSDIVEILIYEALISSFNILLMKVTKQILIIYHYTRRYGPLCGPTSSSCGGLRPSAEAFFALQAKKELFMLFWPIFGDFWCPVVTMVTFTSNLIIFQKSPIIPRGFSTNVTQDKLGF